MFLAAGAAAPRKRSERKLKHSSSVAQFSVLRFPKLSRERLYICLQLVPRSIPYFPPTQCRRLCMTFLLTLCLDLGWNLMV